MGKRVRWWQIVHMYRGRVCYCRIARLMGRGQAGSMPGAGPTQAGITTSGTGKAHRVRHAKPRGTRTTGHGGKTTGTGSTPTAGPPAQLAALNSLGTLAAWPKP